VVRVRALTLATNPDDAHSKALAHSVTTPIGDRQDLAAVDRQSMRIVQEPND
jgi:hypothetical protein